MHQRDICLCPECHARDAVQEDETRTQALVAIATCGARRHPRARIVTAGKCPVQDTSRTSRLSGHDEAA